MSFDFFLCHCHSPVQAEEEELITLSKSKHWTFSKASIKELENFPEVSLATERYGNSSRCGWAWSGCMTVESGPASYFIVC